MQEYLVKIETIIQSKITSQNEAITVLKSNGFSVSSISKELGGSRTTMYNHNQLLKRYIEASETIFNQDNPFIACEELKASKTKLQSKIALMGERDVRIEIVKQENILLTRTISEKDKEIERLQARIMELSKENHELKSKLPKRGVVLHIPYKNNN